jgi:hypothetical protein
MISFNTILSFLFFLRLLGEGWDWG